MQTLDTVLSILMSLAFLLLSVAGIIAARVYYTRDPGAGVRMLLKEFPKLISQITRGGEPVRGEPVEPLCDCAQCAPPILLPPVPVDRLGPPIMISPEQAQQMLRARFTSTEGFPDSTLADVAAMLDNPASPVGFVKHRDTDGRDHVITLTNPELIVRDPSAPAMLREAARLLLEHYAQSGQVVGRIGPVPAPEAA